MPMDVNNEAKEIQNEVLRMLLPFTVDCRALVSFGSTYTTSFCCR